MDEGNNPINVLEEADFFDPKRYGLNLPFLSKFYSLFSIA